MLKALTSSMIINGNRLKRLFGCTFLFNNLCYNGHNIAIYFITFIILLCYFIYSETLGTLFGLFPFPTIPDDYVILPNTTILKSHRSDEIISGIQCLLIVLIVPPIIVLIHHYNTNRDNNFFSTKSMINLIHLILGYLIIILFNGCITNYLKWTISNPRPDFMDRCGPVISYNMLVPFHIKKYCGNDINTFKFRDGLRSTPSGHSTFISCSMSFIYEYLSTTTITNNNKAIRSSHLWCIVITLLVMYSRIVDHRHHWYDVVSGGIIGWTIGRYGYIKILPNIHLLNIKRNSSTLPI